MTVSQVLRQHTNPKRERGTPQSWTWQTTVLGLAALALLVSGTVAAADPLPAGKDLPRPLPQEIVKVCCWETVR